jgi:hypothetical protein
MKPGDRVKLFVMHEGLIVSHDPEKLGTIEDVTSHYLTVAWDRQEIRGYFSIHEAGYRLSLIGSDDVSDERGKQ